MHLAQPRTCLSVYHFPSCFLRYIPNSKPLQIQAEGFDSLVSEGAGDDEAGTNFTPGILAGLNDRSQSA